MFQIAGHTPVPSLLIQNFTLGPCRGQVKMMAASDLLGQWAFKMLADRLHNLAGGLDLWHVSDIAKKAKTARRQIGWRHDAIRHTPQDGERAGWRKRGRRCQFHRGGDGAKRVAALLCG